MISPVQAREIWVTDSRFEANPRALEKMPWAIAEIVVSAGGKRMRRELPLFSAPVNRVQLELEITTGFNRSSEGDSQIPQFMATLAIELKSWFLGDETDENTKSRQLGPASSAINVVGAMYASPFPSDGDEAVIIEQIRYSSIQLLYGVARSRIMEESLFTPFDRLLLPSVNLKKIFEAEDLAGSAESG